ncbi:MAG: hypothetical protein WCO29_11750 [Nostocales cyanobacterium ELA583]
MSAKTRWIILTALIGGAYFWHQHEQYKECIIQQVFTPFYQAKEVCDRRQLLGN